MIEHGIFTSQAHLWAHLFPLERSIYVYRVSRMRWFINYIRTTHSYRGKVAGYSKGTGKATALGELVPRQKDWIKQYFVPISYLEDHKWENETDRENGRRGETVGAKLLSDGVLELPLIWTIRAASRAEQNLSIDYHAKLATEITIEFKTETVEKTDNLFVQTHEYDHDPHITRRSLERRETPFPPGL
jgi:hypothetical protein